jgi:Protein of unknown function (DUF3617)
MVEKNMRKVFAFGCAVAILTGCSGDADKDGDGKVSMSEASKEMATGGAMSMKAGEWETKITFTKIDAKGMPEAAKGQMLDMMGKGVTVKSCMTEEQVKNPGADFFGSPQASNCTFDQMDRSGNSMKVAMTCKPAGATIVKSTMDGQFSAESYEMDVLQQTSGTPMGEMSMTGKISGKRLGDCPA